MARDVNKVTLLGRLGVDPELRYTQAGQPVCNFRMATAYRPAEGAEQTSWHRCTAWGKMAEILSKNLVKGARLYVEGRIDYREWADKEGVKRYSTEIIISDFSFVDSRPSLTNGHQVAEVAGDGEEVPY